LITGTSSGIGRVSAERLVREGFDVLAGVRRESDAPAGCTPVVLDVTAPGFADAASDAVSAHGGSLARLGNNAGGTGQGPGEFLDLDEVRRQREGNLVGPIALTQAVLPALRAGRGRVVNMTSIGGVRAVPFLSPYNASKFALEAVSDALRHEVAPFGIHVSVIEPGSVDTPIWSKGQENAREYVESLPPEAKDLYGERLDRMTEMARKTAERAIPPSKVADAILHALTADRPKTRYLVGVDAKVQSALAKALPDRANDALLRRLTGL